MIYNLKIKTLTNSIIAGVVLIICWVAILNAINHDANNYQVSVIFVVD